MLLSQAAYWCQFYFNNISLDLQIVSGLLRCDFANLQRCCCTVRRCTTTPETVKMFCLLQIISGNPTCSFLALPDLLCGICLNSLFALQIWRNCYLCLSCDSLLFCRLSDFYFHSASMCLCHSAFSVRDEMMGWKVTLAQHCILTCLTRTTHRKPHMFDFRSKASSILRKGFGPCSRADTCTVSIYAAWLKRKKAHSLIVHWTNFSFDDSMRSLWHHFYKLVQCHSIYFQSCIHVLPSSCVDSGGVGPLPNVFSSTS